MNSERNTPNPSPEQRKALALQRLESSRHALIISLSPKFPPASVQKERQPSETGESTLLSNLVSRVQRHGLVAGGGRAVQALARRWWKRQPWNASVELVGGTLVHEVRPLIRRHPWSALAVGAALGATAVLVRPLILRPLTQQLQPWRNNLVGMVWSQVSQVPVQMAIAGALAAWINEASKKSSAEASSSSMAPAAHPVAQSTSPSSPGRY